MPLRFEPISCLSGAAKWKMEAILTGIKMDF
jgi:hypothetical protein